MSKILYCLLACFSFNVYARQCIPESSYHQYYFVNGVNVGINEAKTSIVLIKQQMVIPQEMISLYNPTNYQGGLKEPADKFIDSDNVTDNIAGYVLLGIHYSKTAQRIYNDVWNEVRIQKDYETYMLSRKNSPLAMNMGSPPKNISLSLVNEFKPLLSNHSNVVFAHSQGNFVANELCHHKENKKMEIVSIATPAGELPCNSFENYALFADDAVIGLLRESKALTPAAQFKIPTNFASIESAWDVSSHLVSSYLSHPGY